MSEEEQELPEIQELLDAGLCPLEIEYGVVPGRVVRCKDQAHPGYEWCYDHLEAYGYC